MENQNSLSLKKYFFTLNIVFFAFVVQQLFIAAIMYVLFTFGTEFGSIVDSSLDNILLIVVSAFLFGGIFMSHFLGKLFLQGLKNQNLLKKKLRSYQTLVIIRLAMLEIPGFFALMLFGMTGNNLFLLPAVITVILFFLFKPSKAKLVAELQLNHEEKALIDDPNTVL